MMESTYSMGDQFSRGPYHYSKAYYKSFIKQTNRDNANLRKHRRSLFIPSQKIEKKNFEQRFNVYLQKLIAEEEAEK